MLSGLPPFWGPNTRECFNNIMTAAPKLEGDLWDSVSQLGKDFIHRCAHVSPSGQWNSRPSSQVTTKSG